MPTLFHVTPASTSVKLDTNRKASATFTVTNASGGRMRARANVVVTDASTRDWFRLGQEAEHEFDADGTTQYTVEIAVPSDAPAGRYTFRLDVVGVENPDEDYSEGPPVQVVVAGPVKERKPFPWWILAVVGGVLLVGIILAIVLWPRMTIVPVVFGKSEAVAVEMLEEAHLEPVVKPLADDLEAGLAVGTKPSQNSEVKRGTEVVLHISTGPE
jgi:serine/threonine-protein kinase